MVARVAVAYAERWPVAPGRDSRSPAQPRSAAERRETGRRLALVREATDLARPKPQVVRHARTGHTRPHEALLDLIDASLDATPTYAMPYAGRGWLALLDDLRAHVARRTAAGRAEAEYARGDDE